MHLPSLELILLGMFIFPGHLQLLGELLLEEWFLLLSIVVVEWFTILVSVVSHLSKVCTKSFWW